MREDHPKLAVCITAWKRGDLLAASFESLLRCLDDIEADIWIIDNGSDQSTRGVINHLDGRRNRLFKVMLPVNMGIPYALNLFGAASAQASHFAAHGAPDFVVVLDADLAFKRPMRPLIDLLRARPDLTVLAGHDSVEHEASEEQLVEGFGAPMLLRAKRVERGCYYILRFTDFLEFLPLPHDVPIDIDWQIVRDHPRSLAKTGRKLACIDASIHLGLFDSTHSPVPVPASAAQVLEIVGMLDELGLLTKARRQRALTLVEEAGLSIRLPGRRLWPAFRRAWIK